MTLIDRDRIIPAHRRQNARHLNARMPKRVSTESSGERVVGRVKWFNPGIGYGFISPADGSRDVHVHQNAVRKSGLPPLLEGMMIEFVVGPGRDGKKSAINLHPVQGQ